MKPCLQNENGNQRTPLRVLFFEDETDDIELARRALDAAQFDVDSDVVVTLDQFRDRVRSSTYDVILSDYRMPGNTGMDCHEALKAEGVNTPFILVTGSLGDERAVECLKEGVADYVLKDGLVRLPVAIRRALEEQRLKTQQAETQEALRRSEASYRSLIQRAPCGILRVDALDGHLLEVNRALSDMLGYPSPTDLLNDSAAGNIGIRSEMLESLTNGKKQDSQVLRSDVQWKHKEGETLTIELRGRLVPSANGLPACLELVAENLTERRRAEQRIAQLNRLYSVLSRAGQTIVHIREREKLFQEICRVVVEEGHFQMAWIGLTGVEENVVTPVAGWGDEKGYLDGIHITTTEEPVGCGPVIQAIKESRHVICNYLMTNPSMAPWWERAAHCNYGSIAAFPLLQGGAHAGALVIYASAPDFFDAENVSLLDKLAANLSFALESIATDEMHRRAVDELNQFFALSLDMLCISKTDGYAYRLNPAWERTLGFTPEEMKSRPWVEFVHPEDRPRAIRALAGFSTGRTVEGLELRFLCKDGSYRWLMGSATPAVEPGIVFAAVTDITERRHLEDQLRSQNLELEKQNQRIQAANRMKSEFLANMSHELRSPLNGIIGFTELLYDGKLGAIADKPREFLGRIHRSAKHLLELINGVLDLSKVEAGRIELHTERVELSHLVQEVIGILAALAAEKRIHIESTLDPEVDSVVTDAARFKQILHNYLSNALKFTGEGGRVEVRLGPEGPSEFRLEVADTGIGISARDIPRLFTEFQQLDSSTAKRYQGTGLGLALTKRIVEAEGGRVGVESSPGKGSTFCAVLPRIGRASAFSPSILVIEDEKLQSLVLSKVLRDAGYHVETAATSAEAVRKCRERRFDAITLDLVLPDGSGDRTLAEIRSIKDHQKTPVIVVSVLEEKDAPISRDVQGFLTKPVDEKELIAALEGSGMALTQDGLI